MSAQIMQSLETALLDETQTVPSLLRKCLYLGEVSGSEELRAWASLELNGYPQDVELPAYRMLQHPPLQVRIQQGYQDSIQTTTVLALPEKALAVLPQRFELREGVDEIFAYTEADAIVTTAPLEFAASIWRKENFSDHPFINLVSVRYFLSKVSTLGTISKIRNTLVQLLGELVRNGGNEYQLPSAQEIDDALKKHIPHVTIYNTYFGTNEGSLVIGSHSSVGHSVEEVLSLMEKAFSHQDELPQQEREELSSILSEVKVLLERQQLGTEKGKTILSALQGLAKRIGDTTVKEIVNKIVGHLVGITLPNPSET